MIEVKPSEVDGEALDEEGAVSDVIAVALGS